MVSPPPKSFCRMKARHRLARGGRVLTLKIDPKTIGATQFVVGMETMPPGAVLSAHKHPNQEEVLLIHRGILMVKLGDAEPKEGVSWLSGFHS
jgi:uncharacterized RmlC-like cupin family protein